MTNSDRHRFTAIEAVTGGTPAALRSRARVAGIPRIKLAHYVQRARELRVPWPRMVTALNRNHLFFRELAEEADARTRKGIVRESPPPEVRRCPTCLGKGYAEVPEYFVTGAGCISCNRVGAVMVYTTVIDPSPKGRIVTLYERGATLEEITWATAYRNVMDVVDVLWAHGVPKDDVFTLLWNTSHVRHPRESAQLASAMHTLREQGKSINAIAAETNHTTYMVRRLLDHHNRIILKI